MKHNLNTLKMIVYAVILIGIFTGIIEAASASSNIKVADNGHYFEYDGEPVFLLGLGNWIFMNKIDVDYVAHNQWYQSYGINYNRITLTSTWYTDRSKQVFPWKRSTTPGANDGGNKFDLNEWDPVFWNRLKGYLQDCEDRRIIVCIQFFDECAVESGSDPHRWDYHPFNPQNNINNIPDLDTTDASYSSSTGWSRSFYNVDNSVLMTLQDNYVQKLLDETSQYGNIIYEMANEYGGEGSTQFPGHFAWPQHWIDFFSNYETANGVQLLLTNMPFGVNYNQAEYFAASGIDCIDAYRQFPSYSDVQGVNNFLGAHYNQGKPIFSGKIGNDIYGCTVEQNRKRLWTLFVSGGAGGGLKSYDVGHWAEETTMEEMLSNIHNFIDAGVEFWNMAPSDNLVTSGTGYCLANIGQEYVIYLPDGGSVTVDLSDATGTLNVEWYDPRNGTYTNGGTVTGGGSETFTPPFSDDAVLHIVSTAWHFTDITYANTTTNDSTTHGCDKYMNKTGPDDSEKNISIGGSITAWWYAENAAQCNLSFGENNWSARVYHGVSPTGGNLTVGIYKMHINGSFVLLAFGTEKITEGASSGYIDFACGDNPETTQDFAKGDRLAVRIEWDGPEEINIYYNSASKDLKIMSPSSDPCYPIPKLNTLILFLIGLITLAGYILLKGRVDRWKRKS